MFSCLIIFAGCKKTMPVTDELETGTIKKPASTMTLPGLGTYGNHLVPQPDGTYQAAWQGTMTFGDIPHPITNVVDGRPLEEVNIINVANEYLEVHTAGPFFVVKRPTTVGDSFATVREGIDRFYVAYKNFRDRRKSEFGILLQPQYPSIAHYINIGNANGEIIIHGMLVSSTSSPSKMAVVSANFVPPSNNPLSTLLPEYIVGNVRYDLAGDDTGVITECTAVDMTTNLPVTVYGFSGTYSYNAITEITTVDVKIWTSPTTSISFNGTL